MRRFSRIIIVVFCLSAAGIAQGNNENVYGWVNAGLGYSSLGSLGGIVSLSIQHMRLLFGLRASANSETIDIFGGGDELFDVGLLIGGVLRTRVMIFAISTGIARVSGSRYSGRGGLFGSGNRERISPVIGVPFDAQVIVRSSESFGAGLYGYLNLNREQTFFGIALSVAIGTLD